MQGVACRVHMWAMFAEVFSSSRGLGVTSSSFFSLTASVSSSSFLYSFISLLMKAWRLRGKQVY